MIPDRTMAERLAALYSAVRETRRERDMTGPEHYLEAESLTSEHAARASDKGRMDDMTNWLQCAQVHATLALAAATALGREGEGRTQPSKDRAAWFDVAAECRKAAQS